MNLALVLFLLLFRQVPALVQLIGCTVYYRKAAALGWLPVRYAFIMLKHYYGLEAFLGFNAPAGADRPYKGVYSAPSPARRCVR